MEGRFTLPIISIGGKVGMTQAEASLSSTFMPQTLSWSFTGIHFGPSVGVNIPLYPFMSLFMEGSYLYTPEMENKGVKHSDFGVLNILAYLRFNF